MELPADIISQILVRVPVKPLLCWRCVSKQWCSLIDNPDFINRHIKSSVETNTNHHLIIEEWDETTFTPTNIYSMSIDEGLGMPLRVLNKPPPIGLYGSLFIGSCNGLLLFYHDFEALCLWNPFIRRYRMIPTEKYEKPFGHFPYPLWPSSFGFGYDNINDDYKVVRIMGCKPANAGPSVSLEVKVYSMRTNSWKRVQDFPYPEHFFRPGYGASVSGSSHWLMLGITNDKKVTYLLVAFDYASDKFHVLPHPINAEANGDCCLIVLQQRLCILARQYGYQTTVYMMNKYGIQDSWEKIYAFRQGEIPCAFQDVRPLTYIKQGDKLPLVVTSLEGCRSLALYDLKDKTSSAIDLGNMSGSLGMIECLESLVRIAEDDDFDFFDNGASCSSEDKTENGRGKNLVISPQLMLYRASMHADV